MATKTYDPAKNLISFAGNLLTGFAPDSYIKVEQNAEAFTLTKGAGGESARSKSNNDSIRVTLKLMASSQSNDILSALAAADKLSGAGVAPLFIKELNGTTVVAAGNAWIVKFPDVERGKEIGEVEWMLEADSASVFVGGLLL